VGTAEENSTGTTLNTVTDSSDPLVTNAWVIRDDTPYMRNLLATAKTWWATLGYDVTWTNRCALDIDSTYRPGTLLTSVVMGQSTLSVNTMIARRTWRRVVRNGVDMFDTSYETQRVLPTLESRR
jgi:hypothetical protein